jgi:hypothetical protein
VVFGLYQTEAAAQGDADAYIRAAWAAM